MARPTTITEEQILEAAQDIFLRDGINASTIDIAKKAGVSEGSIFKRFPTKESLFLAATKAPPIPKWALELPSLVGVGDPRENLVHIAIEMLQFMLRVFPLVMLTWGGRFSQPSSASIEEESPVIRDYRLLENYLQQEMDAGRIRQGDQQATAKLFFATAVNYIVESSLFQTSPTSDDVEQFARDFIDVVWDGISPNTREEGKVTPKT